MRITQFPLVLAGPIVRRVEPGRVFIWLATSRKCMIDASFCTIHQLSADPSFDYQPIASLTHQRTVRAGKRLYIHLIKVSPTEGLFPTDTLIGYNLHFSRGTLYHDLKSLHYLSPDQPQSIVYGRMDYPSFLIKSGESIGNIIYGSCRKLHGEGQDMLANADAILEKNYQNTSKRPDSLFMVGDQIYADDVAESIILTIFSLSHDLIGRNEPLVKIDNRLKEKRYSMALQQINGRQSMIENLAKFTTSRPENHLIEFGEYAAMYLLSWNPALWTGIQLDRSHGGSFSTKQQKTDLLKLSNPLPQQQDALFTFQQSLTSVRRLLANIPTYMIFDDHDITDDWNISATWRKNVHNSKFGSHIIANGLAAYWAFQGWGNDPDAFDDQFIQLMETYFKNLWYRRFDLETHEQWKKQLWSFHSWHFVAPTQPKAVFLDTRTQRDYDSEPYPEKLGHILKNSEGCPQLISKYGWALVTDKLLDSAWQPRSPLMIISATPVYGMGLIESFLQNFIYPFKLLGVDVRTSFDFEAWKYNGKGFTQFLSKVNSWNPSKCIILSGDVHYASAVKAKVTFSNGNVLSLHQFTSSPFKNMSFSGVWGYLMKKVIDHNSLIRKHKDIHRVCDPSYHIAQIEKSEESKLFLWKDQLRYQFVAEDSLVEINNNFGFLSIHHDEIQSTLINDKK